MTQTEYSVLAVCLVRHAITTLLYRAWAHAMLTHATTSGLAYEQRKKQNRPDATSFGKGP